MAVRESVGSEQMNEFVLNPRNRNGEQSEQGEPEQNLRSGDRNNRQAFTFRQVNAESFDSFQKTVSQQRHAPRNGQGNQQYQV